MKRVVGALVALFAFLILAAPSPAFNGGARDRLFGIGQRANLAGEQTTTVVYAEARPTGERPTGFFTIVAQQATGPVFMVARVTCLHVSGNRAIAAGIVVRSTNSIAPVGTLSAVQVTDDGVGQDTNINAHQLDSSFETECALIDFPEQPVITGDFVVTDA